MILSLNPFRKKILLCIGVGLFFVWHLQKIGPENTYALDSFVKLIQTISIKENHYSSEELLYLAKPLDPEQVLHPLPTFYIKLGSKSLSPFSVDFAFIFSLLLNFLQPSHLPYVCFVFAFLTFLFLAKEKNFRFPTLLLGALGTPLIYQGLEYSENSLLVLLQTVGILLFYRGDRIAEKFFSALFLTLGIFLRLESLLFVFTFIFLKLILVHRLNIIQFLKREWSTLLGIFIPAFVFIFQNLILYNHFLGARFISNQSSLDHFHLLERLIQMKNLMFLTYLKIGFFGFTPLFLWSIAYLLLHLRIISDMRDKVLLFTVVLFLPSVAFIAPNDGVTNWGARYLNLGIVPCLFLFNRFYEITFSNSKKLWKILFYFLFVYSFIILTLGLKFQQVATKEIRLFQEDLFPISTKLHVLGAETIGLYSGAHFYDQLVILPKSPEQLDRFFSENKTTFNHGDKILLSKIKPNPVIQEGIRAGLFPNDSHYDSFRTILKKYYPVETIIEGKKLILYQYSQR